MSVVGEAPDAARTLRTEQYEYVLPESRVAQEPAEPRDSSRLLHLAPDGTLGDLVFRDLPNLLRAGDLLVANDTRVRAARLRGHREDGGSAEVLLLERLSDGRYTALVRPGRRLTGGARVNVGNGLSVAIEGLAAGHPGARIVHLTADGDVEEAIAAAGHAPVPPYITGSLRRAERYQTVYAAGDPASAAAPTAGLHFTRNLIDRLRELGVGWDTVQLDVGLGTFAPITVAHVAEHRMHAERCTVSSNTVERIESTRAAGGRVVAVGTTVVRTLESHLDERGRLIAGSLSTDLFIRPGHRFGVVDGLLTNFHQPRSSLLVLLAAFVGSDAWRGTYEHALARGYRFLSFGDCMLCWRGGQER